MSQEHSEQAKHYNPSDYLIPLTNGDGMQEIMDLIIQDLAPFLDAKVLSKHGKEVASQEILSVRTFLRQKFQAILTKRHLSCDMPDQEGIPAIEDLCRPIKGRELRRSMRVELNEQRDLLSADILERLGFLPKKVFDRDGYANGGKDNTEKAERRFQFISEILDKEGEIGDGYGDMNGLRQWRDDVNKSIDICVSDAANYLSDYRMQMVPKGRFRQPYELYSDLGSKSLVELFEICMDKTLKSRRRIDALKIIQWAIGFYTIRTNPVFNAQNKVKRDLDQLLNLELWAPNMSAQPKPIKYDARKRKFVIAPDGDHATDFAIARRVNTTVKDLLGEHDTVVKDPDCLFFDTRSKTEVSILVKLLLMQAKVREAIAKINGLIVDGIDTVEDARHYLREIQAEMDSYFGEANLEEKPADFKVVRDNVGLTFALMTKDLPPFKAKPKRQKAFDDCFEKFAKYIIHELGLTNVVLQNKLWARREKNHKRSKHFRDFKIYAAREVSNGEVGVKMPIEIQIQPRQTFLATRSPGDHASKDKYKLRKSKILEDLIMPRRIGGEVIFPRVKEDALIGAVDPAVHMVGATQNS